VRWYEDVAPIAYTHCAGCHRSGGIAPFDISSADAVRTYGVLMAANTRARVMPPMPLDNSGSCTTFSNARWLSDAEIAVFQSWVAGGMMMGNAADAPPFPGPAPGLATVSATLDIGVSFTPMPPTPGLIDEYRCFIVDPGNAMDQYVTAYEVVPGDARIVHHVIVYSLPTASDELQAMTLDNADPLPGYDCFGGPGASGSSPIALWAPGTGPTTYPASSGVLLNGGRHVVVQIHYNLAAGTFPDRTRVNLTLTSSMPNRGYLVPMLDTNLTLPPGMSDVSATNSTPLTSLPLPVHLYGVGPHMHTLGRTLRVETTGTGGQCLGDVQNWDFRWQGMWWYSHPILVRPSDTVQITCHYDTTGRTTTTRWGESTSDEMCLAYFYVAL
jgi:hypothetical protein